MGILNHHDIVVGTCTYSECSTAVCETAYFDGLWNLTLLRACWVTSCTHRYNRASIQGKLNSTWPEMHGSICCNVRFFGMLNEQPYTPKMSLILSRSFYQCKVISSQFDQINQKTVIYFLGTRMQLQIFQFLQILTYLHTRINNLQNQALTHVHFGA